MAKGVAAVAGVGAAVYCCAVGGGGALDLGSESRGRSFTMPVGSGAPLKLKLMGKGGGTADEMVAALPANAVSFTLLRHAFGASSQKFVFIQYVGPSSSIVKRGRHIARKDDVKAALEEFGLQVHHEMHSDDLAELSHAAIDAELHKSSVDDGLQGFSAAGAKAAQEAAIEKAKAEAQDAFLSLPQVLEKVADVNGESNWCTMSADKNPAVTGEGIGSIEEMRLQFAPNVVCGAMLRLQFKTPGALLTKFVYIWWSGGAVGAVKRGRLTSLEQVVEESVRPHCPIHCNLEATDPDETSVAAIIEKVKSIIVATDEEKQHMTVDNFQAALAEATPRCATGSFSHRRRAAARC